MHRLGFALIPNNPEPLFTIANSVADAHPCSFVMRKGETVPHVSLFQGVYADQGLVLSALTSLQRVTLPQELSLSGLSVWAQKIVFLDLAPHPTLQALHECIFTTFFPLAHGSSADPQAFVGITEGQARSFKETGYPFSRAEFLPHFTIAHLQQNDGRGSTSLASVNHPLAVTFSELVCFRVGDKGVVTEILGRQPIAT